ncbi:hypothetical protein [Neobacillus sp. D3-1R]|uniref:hypothetical protein n=1 Tax=Neobacillus sp. D3-1R TaxID=3445778 RepID=UPI003F9FBAA5
MSNRHNYDLTGTWKGYNRHGEYIANYYIRQTEAGSSVQIHWIGLSRDPDYFSETFYGNRVGDLIIGQWVNVPRGAADNIGSLQVRVEDNGRKLVQVDATENYDVVKWKKVSNGFPRGSYS